MAVNLQYLPSESCENSDRLPVTWANVWICGPFIPLYTGHIYAASMVEIDESAYKFIICSNINSLNLGCLYRFPGFNMAGHCHITIFYPIVFSYNSKLVGTGLWLLLIVHGKIFTSVYKTGIYTGVQCMYVVTLKLFSIIMLVGYSDE